MILARSHTDRVRSESKMNQYRRPFRDLITSEQFTVITRPSYVETSNWMECVAMETSAASHMVHLIWGGWLNLCLLYPQKFWYMVHQTWSSNRIRSSCSRQTSYSSRSFSIKSLKYYPSITCPNTSLSPQTHSAQTNSTSTNPYPPCSFNRRWLSNKRPNSQWPLHHTISTLSRYLQTK